MELNSISSKLEEQLKQLKEYEGIKKTLLDPTIPKNLRDEYTLSTDKNIEFSRKAILDLQKKFEGI